MSITCVIIETRDLDNIREVIVDNHLNYLPEGSNVLFFHSNNSEFISSNLLNLPIIYINLDILFPIKNEEHSVYMNKLLTYPSFWSKVLEYSEKILMIQPDSKILRTGIEYFTEWDYIGAPWSHANKGGNGGFSWRNAKIMKEISELLFNDNNYNTVLNDEGISYDLDFINEDMFFSYKLESVGGKLAPRNVCSQFSCESIYQEGTFGCHAIEKYLSTDEVKKIYNQYE